MKLEELIRLRILNKNLTFNRRLVITEEIESFLKTKIASIGDVQSLSFVYLYDLKSISFCPICNNALSLISFKKGFKIK